MTPDNFADFWNTMTPLIKPDITKNDEKTKYYKTELLSLVVLKDNIGEAFWYMYTAMLIASVVYYNLANVGCKKSVAQIKAGYDDYIQQQEAIDQKTALNTSIQASLS
jgi:hypothetical protein